MESKLVEISSEDAERLIEACYDIQDIVGDFATISRESPEEVNIAEKLMRVSGTLIEVCDIFPE